MKKVWLNIEIFNKDFITTALECGVKTFLVSDQVVGEEILKLAKVEIILRKDIIFYEYQNQSDEDKILDISRDNNLVLESKTWEIIPWENLIAKGAKFFVFVKNIDDIKNALKVLEIGVYGVIINTVDRDILKEILKKVYFKKSINLSPAKVTKIKILDSGDRVCVDTCNLMSIGEGLLIGNSSNCLFLVHSESIENSYCSPRPFRVNAGPVHAYVMVNEGKTKYLSEINSGDEVAIVNYKGEVRVGVTGRSKIEVRPLLMVEAISGGTTYSVILQNAETINLVKEDGNPVSVTNLKEGDNVLVYLDTGGRHFGIKIEESIVEK